MNTGVGPLAGYRVLDLSDIKGQQCGRILADLGAEVIKVERPEGDHVRSLGPFYHGIPDHERSLLWFVLNANKKSITLNLWAAQGRDIFGRLVSTADFVIESFRPGHLGELGLGYGDLEKISPRIVLTSITPFGQAGPYKDFKTSDLVTTAMGGLLYRMGDPDHPPVRISVPQSYAIAGAQAAALTMIAHYHRQRTGEGQHVDVSMQECQAITLERQVGLWQYDRHVIRRSGQKVHRGQTLHRELWRCKDGFVSFRVMVGPYFHGTAPIIKCMKAEGIGGEFSESGYWEKVSFDAVSQEQIDAWEEKIAEFFVGHTKAELLRLTLDEGAHVFPLYSMREALGSDQLSYRGYWILVEHPELKERITYPGRAFRSKYYTTGARRRAPLIGEHNAEIYCRDLGFSAADVSILKASRVI